jgi:hypothetical protein
VITAIDTTGDAAIVTVAAVIARTADGAKNRACASVFGRAVNRQSAMSIQFNSAIYESTSN